MGDLTLFFYVSLGTILLVLLNISDGEKIIVFSSVGYKKTEQRFTFPLSSTATIMLVSSADGVGTKLKIAFATG